MIPVCYAMWAVASAGQAALEMPIPANTWMEAKLTYFFPENLPGARWATSDGYDGSAFRSKTGTILFRRGVESLQVGLSPGFYSNATVEWAPASEKARAVEVSNWGGGSYGGGKLLPAFKDHPTPTPRHTYDGIAYVEPEDSLYLVLGANWRIASEAERGAEKVLDQDNNSTWKYSFPDGRWKRIDHNVHKVGYTGSPYENHLRWWPEGKRLLFLSDDGSFYAEFDLATQTWAKADLKNKCPMRLYNARSTWDSKRQLWVFRLGPNAATFDPKTREFKTLPNIYDMPTDEKDRRRDSKGIVYITRHDVYLATGINGNDTWIYEVGKGKWVNIKGGEIALVNGYPQYDVGSDLVGLVFESKAFRFRYVPEGAIHTKK